MSISTQTPFRCMTRNPRSSYVLLMAPLMQLGADVSHGPSGADRHAYAAMVGSIDLRGTKYAAACNINGIGTEIITAVNMRRFTKTLLRSFRANTGQVPARILYFRDGVSESQYASVLELEVAEIRAACRELQPAYQPKITLTVVAKRHHTRLFPLDGAAIDRNGNALPGVIVERDATHPSEYDFFLVSHCALQGTAKPTHYQVLTDENCIPVDAFQALCYNMCFIYARSTTSVSLVPAVYYAHLASARCRALENREEGNTLDDLLPLNQALTDLMWYL